MQPEDEVMPTVTGEIRFKGFILYMFVAVAEIRSEPALPFLPQGRGMGLFTDPLVEDGRRLIHLIHDNPDEFMEHLSDISAPGANAIGLRVWEGDVLLLADGTIEFKGKVRRPTGDDYVKLSEIQEFIDKVASETAWEHAKHCKACAAKLGMNPDLVEDDDDEDDFEGSIGATLWPPRGCGEA